MQKILVLSDSHGNYTKIQSIIDEASPFDYLIYCGDGVNDLIHVHIPHGVKVVKISGNVDLARGIEYDRIHYCTINHRRFMITHGDLFRVQNGFEYLIKEGEKKEVDIILFGHTHIKYHNGGNPILFNPGTAAKGSYGIILLNDTIDFLHHRV